MTRYLRRALAGGASVLALAAAGPPATAQSFNLYSQYNQSVTLDYLSQSGGTPQLLATFRGGTAFATNVQVTMDTGSTGMIIGSNYIDVTGLQPKGQGNGVYTSDNLPYSGTFYDVPVTITGAGSGSASGTVRVLVVPGDTRMMGIGFDRGGNAGTDPKYPSVEQNAFLSVTQINGDATSSSTYRSGYVVRKDSVTIGLTGDLGSSYAMVKLTPNTIHPPNQWNRPQMGVTVDNVYIGIGDFLPDTGIPYMLITPMAGVPSQQTCPVQGICTAQGLPVQIVLLPQVPGGLAYTFTTNEPGTSPLTPDYVNLRAVNENNTLNIATPVSVNSGVNFYQGFDYLFDYDGGWVGYRSTGATGVTGFVPLLAMQSTVTLQSGFSTDLPTWLIGDTTLTTQTGGTAAFSGPLMGLGNNLTLGGGGTFAFNDIVYLGGGILTVHHGAASINAGLVTPLVSVDQRGVLTNGSNSVIVGNISNAGTVTNNGVIVGNVGNSGMLTNIGTIAGNVGNTGTLANAGAIWGNVASSGMLAGTGSIGGNVSNAGTISPGNSIGTFSIAGNYMQTASSSYLAEVNSTGQSDRVDVGGTASLQGGTVAVTALPGGVYAPRTTYTILSAAGGLNGSFSSVTDPYPFLQSSLSYDANNAYLNLQIGGFAAQALNPNQYAVGTALDAGALQATGDFASVLGALATATAAQGQAAMTAFSGSNYAGLSSSMVQTAMLFMNNFTGQTGGATPSPSRVALAEACDVACDTTAPAVWGAWGGALGGLGTIGAGQAVGSVTYNAGGFAAGLDREVIPGVRLGVTAGYTSGTQWVSGFSGKSTSDTILAGLYGNFVRDKVYADAIVGYAYSYNQMWRQISLSGLQPRTAQGQTGANQFYGQLETGYRFDIGTAAQAYVTPFARLQGYTGTQNGFTENGAQSLNLTVAQQNTSSLRTVLGAQLGGAMDLGWREKLALQFRLGWSHEYASTARPVTATLAGAPLSPFTTFGVAPQRDGALVGFSANTAIADATSVYLRYEGNISGQDSAHALTAGVRMTW